MAYLGGDDAHRRSGDATLEEGLEYLKWCGFVGAAGVGAIVSIIVFQFPIWMLLSWWAVFIVGGIVLAIACARWRPKNQTLGLSSRVLLTLLLISGAVVLLASWIGAAGGLSGLGMTLGAVASIPSMAILMVRWLGAAFSERATPNS